MLGEEFGLDRDSEVNERLADQYIIHAYWNLPTLR